MGNTWTLVLQCLKPKESLKEGVIKLVSEEIILELRTQLTIWCITGQAQYYYVKQLNGKLYKITTQKLWNFLIEIETTQPN